MTAIPPPPELPGEASPLAGQSAARSAWRNRHWTAPVASLPLMAAAGEAAGLSGAHMDIGIGAGAGVSVMALLAASKWDRAAERWYACGTAAAAGGWLEAASWFGLDWWTLGTGCAVCAAWGIPWYVHKRPRRRNAGAAAVQQWNAWWQHYAPGWNLAGSRVAEVTVKGVTVTLTVQLWAGKQSHQSIGPVVHLIESACRDFIGAGMIRVEQNKKNGSQVFLHLKRSDPLAREIAWDPSWLPSSVTGTMICGVAEGGSLVRVPMLASRFTTGATRSGKSNEQSVELASITACPDAVVWMIDRKGGRAARPWMEALDWVATTTEEARLMLEVAAAEVEARAALAYDGNEQLEPTAEVPAIFVIVDEAHEVFSVTRGDTRSVAYCSAIAAMGAGVAIHPRISTQYGALDESVRTEQIRSNLPLRLCFRTETAAHGVFALGDKSKADASRLRGKGSFYFKLGPDVPEEQARGPHMPHSLVREIAKRHGAMPRQPLSLFAGQFQAVYDARWSRLPEQLRHLAPQYVPGSPAADEAEVMTAPPPDEAMAAAQRIEDEIAATPDVPLLSLPQVPDFAVRDEMARGQDRFAAALQRAPEPGISPKQLTQASGMSRSWIMSQLASLTRIGAAEIVTKGMYRPAIGRDIRDAMDEIRNANGRLLEAAGAA